MICIYKDIIKKYINLLTLDDVKRFADKEKIAYTDDEAIIIYNFIMYYYNDLLNENKLKNDIKNFQQKMSGVSEIIISKMPKQFSSIIELKKSLNNKYFSLPKVTILISESNSGLIICNKQPNNVTTDTQMMAFSIFIFSDSLSGNIYIRDAKKTIIRNSYASFSLTVPKLKIVTIKPKTVYSKKKHTKLSVIIVFVFITKYAIIPTLKVNTNYELQIFHLTLHHL